MAVTVVLDSVQLIGLVILSAVGEETIAIFSARLMQPSSKLL
jgi:hypothetical protein